MISLSECGTFFININIELDDSFMKLEIVTFSLLIIVLLQFSVRCLGLHQMEFPVIRWKLNPTTRINAWYSSAMEQFFFFVFF